MDFGRCSKERLAVGFFWLFLSILAFSSPTPGEGQYGNSLRKNLIEWSGQRPLVWSDYEARPDENHPVTALTNAGFGIQTGRHSDGQMYVDVKTHFDRNESWTKDTANPYLLNHEQMHFNLVEIYARETRKAIAEMKIKQGKAGMEQLDKVFKQHYRILSEKQTMYDKETGHSLNRAAQAKWDAWILAELTRLQAYSESRVNLRIN